MKGDGAGVAPTAGNRVVMLVDNGVHGDSRVQKAARSAADAGWEVILLGRSPGGPAQSWQLGGAEVRLIPMPDPLHRRRHEFRRAWLRWPLAYPPNGVAAHRQQSVKAWRADLAVRAAQLAVADPTSPRLELRHRALRAEQVAARVAAKWVSGRYWMLTQARRRRRLRNPWDRAYTLFWQAVKGGGAWRRLEPSLWDWELAFGPVIDELRPDLIHANDFRMLGVAARAKVRAAVGGHDIKLVWDAHEFLPGLRPRQDNARWLPANRAHEREYAPFADAVVTVSEALADLLVREHGLAERPAVVMNAPSLRGAGQVDADVVGDVGGIRSRCGVGVDTPLLAYSGGVAPVRGVDVMVDGLPQLPGVHVVLVSLPPGRSSTSAIDALLARAVRLGVADRVHVLPYVPHDQVARFLSSADAAVSPLVHLPNHEIALSNKFFEYSHARLPIVVSDVKTMAEMVRATGQGEVFRAKDVDDYVRAVRAVLADPARYRAAYERPGLLESWTWEAQAEVLDAVYRRMLPAVAAGGAGKPVAGDSRPVLSVGT